MTKEKRQKNRSRLATQIRISYIVLLLPSLVFIAFAFYNMQRINKRNNDMISSVVKASEFSLQFKEDFDNETYLLIVGYVTPDSSGLKEDLSKARQVVSELKDYTTTEDNQQRLAYAEKYLTNLETYVDRITENLRHENKYEDNMLIWENDVQIVTALLKDTINEYIYYENRQIQTVQAQNNAMFVNIVEISIGLLAFSLVSMIIVSYFGPKFITKPIEEQVKEEQKLLRKAEFDLLQSQINPHFLYNTLDAIVWSAEAGNQKQVVSMVGNLSDFFRLSLNKGKENVLIREELQHVRSYLEIQHIRYQDILTFEINVPEEFNEYKIPKLTIQPIVENALYHGIKNKRGGGKITIYAEEKRDHFTIVVEDTGKGMDEERLRQVRKAIRNGTPEKNVVYGLYNVNERIRLNFGEGYGIHLESVLDKGTRVRIRLPKK
ncbi:MAG TPA: sensor histidine kinase [Clostridiales bacterium]|nr:sensor histidine kinase [Clostridiales bacterium]HBZ77902.1 sensor histidine kinase [Clostridiales bacterium]